jgi:hypothetical protein
VGSFLVCVAQIGNGLTERHILGTPIQTAKYPITEHTRDTKVSLFIMKMMQQMMALDPP